jgi:colanic acid/amylovoran biosynthesis glycosyltransferase
MTLAYLINQYPQASQSFIRREIAALERLGVRVERFTLRRWPTALVDPGDQAEKSRTRAVLETGKLSILAAVVVTLMTRPIRFLRTMRLALRVARPSGRGRTLHLIYLAEACVLLRWLRQCGAEHLHAHFGTNSTTVAMLCQSLGGPSFSFTAHGPEEFDSPIGLSLGEKICRARFVVAVSDFGRSQLYRWCPPRDWPKVHIVRCGVDSDFLSRPTIPVPEAPRLVCVGRLTEQKGQLLLIAAAARLRADGHALELRLVGDGEMRGEIEREIERLGLIASVKILGWLSNDQVRMEIEAARAMVLPSFAEGLPVVIMEALALGRPVISTYVAGIPELVQETDCGWLVPAGAVDALAGAMQFVLHASPERLTQMGAAGRARVLRDHDVDINATRLLQLFRQTPIPASKASSL